MKIHANWRKSRKTIKHAVRSLNINFMDSHLSILMLLLLPLHSFEVDFTKWKFILCWRCWWVDGDEENFNFDFNKQNTIHNTCNNSIEIQSVLFKPQQTPTEKDSNGMRKKPHTSPECLYSSKQLKYRDGEAKLLFCENPLPTSAIYCRIVQLSSLSIAQTWWMTLNVRIETCDSSHLTSKHAQRIIWIIFVNNVLLFACKVVFVRIFIEKNHKKHQKSEDVQHTREKYAEYQLIFTRSMWVLYCFTCNFNPLDFVYIRLFHLFNLSSQRQSGPHKIHKIGQYWHSAAFKSNCKDTRRKSHKMGCGTSSWHCSL